MEARRLVDPVLFAVAVAWGSTYLVTKELLPDASYAPALLALRLSLATIAMLAVLVWIRRLPRRPELTSGAAAGLVLAAIFAFETYGVALTTATNAGVLISLNMVLTPLVGSLVSRRRPSGRFLALAGVAVVGVALLATNGHAARPHVGDWLILAAAALRAVHVTLLGEVQRRRVVDSRALTAVQMGTVSLVFLALSLVAGTPRDYLADVTSNDVALLLWLALGCTVFAFFAQTWAIAHTSPSRVSLLLGTEPVWAALIGVGIAHEHISPVGIIGIVLTIVATLAARRLEDDAPSRDGDVALTDPPTPLPRDPGRLVEI